MTFKPDRAHEEAEPPIAGRVRAAHADLLSRLTGDHDAGLLDVYRRAGSVPQQQPPRRTQRLPWLTAACCLVVAVAGIAWWVIWHGVPPGNEIDPLADDQPFPPISFVVDSAGQISITASQRFVTPLGEFRLTAEDTSTLPADVAALAAKPDSAPLLIMCQKDSSERWCAAYRINTSRAIEVEGQGHTIGIPNHSIRVDVTTGTTVIVRERQPPSHAPPPADHERSAEVSR